LEGKTHKVSSGKSSVTFRLNKQGRIEQAQIGSKDIWHYQYDGDYLTQVMRNKSSHSTYAWKDQQLIKVTDAEGTTTQLSYKNNRVASWSQGDCKEQVDFQKQGARAVTQVKRNCRGEPAIAKTFQMTGDASFQNAEVQEKSGSQFLTRKWKNGQLTKLESPTVKAQFEYDPLGHIQSFTSGNLKFHGREADRLHVKSFKVSDLKNKPLGDLKMQWLGDTLAAYELGTHRVTSKVTPKGWTLRSNDFVFTLKNPNAQRVLAGTVNGETVQPFKIDGATTFLSPTQLRARSYFFEEQAMLTILERL
jgi:hypothetical protein